MISDVQWSWARQQEKNAKKKLANLVCCILLRFLINLFNPFWGFIHGPFYPLIFCLFFFTLFYKSFSFLLTSFSCIEWKRHFSFIFRVCSDYTERTLSNNKYKDKDKKYEKQLKFKFFFKKEGSSSSVKSKEDNRSS